MMAEWKLPMTYNYSSSYHAYAYGFVCPTAPEQSHPNVEWPEAAFNHGGVAGGYYSAPQPQHQDQSQPNPTVDGNAPNTGPVLYYSDTRAAGQRPRCFFSHDRIDQSEQVPKENKRTCNDTPSDAEAHTPDSWSSASNGDGCAPQASIAMWEEKDRRDEIVGASPDSSEPVSSSFALEEKPREIKEEEKMAPVSFSPVPSSQDTQVPPRKAKPRTAFSEGQMNVLTHRFNMQRYLTPVEMKTLAGFTGLTYKQVKTWFQNRRMKLKRHQKENNWMSERYSNSSYAGVLPHPEFRHDPGALMQDRYLAPQFRNIMFAKNSPQTPAFCSGCPPHAGASHAPAEAPGSWSLGTQATQYDYSSSGYGGSSDEGTSANAVDSPVPVMVTQSATQWTT